MPPVQSATYKQKAPYIYGSSRLGINALEADLVGNTPPQVMNFVHTEHESGRKYYEFTNHLGNVLATFTDKKTTHDANANGTVDYLTADLKTVQDYSPFGVLLDGRNWESKKYRFGFDGKENDNEVEGTGNWQNYGMRMYSPRLGRFPSIDQLTKRYPWYAPYQFAGNKLIWAVDLDGKEEFVRTIYYVNGKFRETVLTVVSTYGMDSHGIPDKQYVHNSRVDINHGKVTVRYLFSQTGPNALTPAEKQDIYETTYSKDKKSRYVGGVSGGPPRYVRTKVSKGTHSGSEDIKASVKDQKNVEIISEGQTKVIDENKDIDTGIQLPEGLNDAPMDRAKRKDKDGHLVGGATSKGYNLGVKPMGKSSDYKIKFHETEITFKAVK